MDKGRAEDLKGPRRPLPSERVRAFSRHMRDRPAPCRCSAYWGTAWPREGRSGRQHGTLPALHGHGAVVEAVVVRRAEVQSDLADGHAVGTGQRPQSTNDS